MLSQPAVATELTQGVGTLDAQARGLMTIFMRAGYEEIAPPVIQPAGPFLDVVGEALRARTYVFIDPDGEELCLRPDLTIPTCRLHLARHPGGQVRARYCYRGPAFRYQPGGATSAHPREFRQAGIEIFAAPDREQEDAAVLALMVEALRRAGLDRLEFTIGDLGLFAALLEAIPMPQALAAAAAGIISGAGGVSRRVLMRLTSREALKSHGLPHELVERLDPAARGRRAFSSKIISTGRARADRHAHAAGNHRTPACRGRRCARERRCGDDDGRPDRELHGWSSRPRARPCERFRALLRPHKIDLGPALERFRRRLDLLDAAGVDTASAVFAAVVRAQPRVLYRLRVRDRRSRARAHEARSPAVAATTACWPTSGAPGLCRRSARASTPSVCWRCWAGKPHEREMNAKLVLALPSKGRLMEQCASMLAKAGSSSPSRATSRGYKGEIAGLPGVEVKFVSSSEIAQLLKNGTAHMGITGEDLLRETIADCDER